MNLGENIYRLRTEKNMSQGDLADALGVSRQSVSKWENNIAVPELEKLMKMSQLFGISLDELVGGESPRDPQAPKTSVPPIAQIPTQKIAGTLLLVSALLCFLVPASLGSIGTGAIMCAPFALCGIICFVCKHHLGLWCTWVFALPAVFTPMYEFIRIYEARLITTALWTGMLGLTLWCLRKDPVILNKSAQALLILGYILWFAYILPRILKLAGLLRLELIQDTTIAYWIDAAAYLLFTALFSVTTRLLKRK